MAKALDVARTGGVAALILAWAVGAGHSAEGAFSGHAWLPRPCSPSTPLSASTRSSESSTPR